MNIPRNGYHRLGWVKGVDDAERVPDFLDLTNKMVTTHHGFYGSTARLPLTGSALLCPMGRDTVARIEGSAGAR